MKMIFLAITMCALVVYGEDTGEQLPVDEWNGSWGYYDPSEYNNGQYVHPDAPSNPRCAAFDAEGNLWCATERGFMHTFQEGKWSKIRIMEQISLTGIVLDSDSTFWISSANGLYHFDPRSRQILFAYTTMSDFPSNDVRGVALDSDGTVWAATADGVVERSGTDWISYNKTTNPEFIPDLFHNVFFSRDGSCWLLSERGIYRREPDSTAWENMKDLIGIGDSRVMFEAQDGTLWFSYGFSNGAVAFNPADSSTLFFDEYSQYALPDAGVSSFMEDHAGTIWIGTVRGPVRADTTNWQSFTSSNSEFKGGRVRAMLETPHRDMWFFGDLGATRMNSYFVMEPVTGLVRSGEWYDTASLQIVIKTTDPTLALTSLDASVGSFDADVEFSPVNNYFVDTLELNFSPRTLGICKEVVQITAQVAPDLTFLTSCTLLVTFHDWQTLGAPRISDYNCIRGVFPAANDVVLFRYTGTNPSHQAWVSFNDLETSGLHVDAQDGGWLERTDINELALVSVDEDGFIWAADPSEDYIVKHDVLSGTNYHRFYYRGEKVYNPLAHIHYQDSLLAAVSAATCVVYRKIQSSDGEWDTLAAIDTLTPTSVGMPHNYFSFTGAGLSAGNTLVLGFGVGIMLQGSDGTWSSYDNITHSGRIPQASFFTLDADSTLWFADEFAIAGKRSGGESSIFHDANVRSVAQVGGDAWFGTTEGITFFRNGKWESILPSDAGLASDTVLTIAEDTSRGCVWLGISGENRPIALYLNPAMDTTTTKVRPVSTQSRSVVAAWAQLSGQQLRIRTEPGRARYSLFDARGRVVMAKHLQGDGSVQTITLTNTLAQGWYFLTVNTANITRVQRVFAW